jgi:hypothetical protein
LHNSNLDDKQKNKKEEGAKGLASNKNILHSKIQLWTNNEENEYAIRLLLDGDPEYETREKEGRRDFIASTDPKERYTHPIAETDKLNLLQNGWDYALKDLIKTYKKERIEMEMSSASTSLKDDDLKHHNFGSKDSDYPIKFISPHKCRYCLAAFKNEEERKIHELKWHI